MGNSTLLRSMVLLAVALCGTPRAHAQPPGLPLQPWIDARLPQLLELYRDFHQHPELSFFEERTAETLAAALRRIGYEVTTGVGGHGVVALLRNGEGPTLMLRTDLDALPVEEQTGLPFASKVRVTTADGTEVPVMHACGHDLHMTNLFGVAWFMAEHREQWRGTLMLVGQPAEERGAGAKAMLEDGLFTRFPKPDWAVALHVDAAMETGKVGVRSGYALANVDSVDIILHGRGGHGAFPHTTIDPVVQAAELILSLQTIVSREIKPIEPAVITVGAIHAGTKHNIISDRCHLQLTVRSYSDEVRQHLLEGIKRKARAVAMGARAPEPDITVSEGTPALYNDPQLTSRLRQVFQRELGDENVVESEPSMGGEDFSQYGRAGVPIVMYRLGVIAPERMKAFQEKGEQPPSLHSPFFYPDAEPALRTGLRTMIAAALELLQPAGQ